MLQTGFDPGTVHVLSKHLSPEPDASVIRPYALNSF